MNGREIKNGEIRFLFWALQQVQFSVAEGTSHSPLADLSKDRVQKELCA